MTISLTLAGLPAAGLLVYLIAVLTVALAKPVGTSLFAL